MSNPIQDQIKKTIQENPVVIFMKGTPDAPQCGFSSQAVRCLKMAGANPVGVNVLADPQLRHEIKVFSNWPTLPQVFINGEFIGGCDIVTEMYDSGELKEKLSGKI